MKPRICFLSLNSYPLLNSNNRLEYIGGAEVVQVMIGKELARRGYEVSFITYLENGEDDETFNGIRIIKSYPRSDRLSLFKRIRIIFKCLRKSRSDIYIHSSGFPGVLPLFCLFRREKFYNRLSSNCNITLDAIGEKSPATTKIALYMDIKLADRIVVQNNFQKDTLKKKYGIDGILIKNPICITDRETDGKERFKNRLVLWIGTIRSIKQPEIFLRLAKELPEYKFRMIGGRDDMEQELYDSVKSESETIPNLDFLGFVPFDQIDGHIDGTAVLVNTSKNEGFPNTFLQAWLAHTPVISLNVDPDEIIHTHKLGFHSKSFEQMANDLRTLMNDEKLWKEIGDNARGYVEEKHDLGKVVESYCGLFEDGNP